MLNVQCVLRAKQIKAKIGGKTKFKQVKQIRKEREEQREIKRNTHPTPARPSDEQFQITVRVMDGVIMMDDDDERMMVTEMVINTHTTAPCVPVQ